MDNTNEQTSQSNGVENCVLDDEYTSSKNIAGILVELTVSEVTIPDNYAETDVLTTDPKSVNNELAFRDFATANEYTITASGETVIDGGENARVGWLESTLMEEVGKVRRVKEELMGSGFDVGMTLNEMAQQSEEAVVRLYQNSDVKNAELMAKAISFSAAEEEIDGTEDIPDASEIRRWVDKTRNELESAIEALEDIDDLARKSIGEAYEKGQDSGELPTDISEIRTRIYDSDFRDAQSYVESKEFKLPDGSKLKITSNRVLTKLQIEQQDGSVQTLSQSDSPSEIMAQFNKRVNNQS